MLPAYCDPPNPCPIGYTAKDGCISLEDFENTSEFSRKVSVSEIHRATGQDVAQEMKGN